MVVDKLEIEEACDELIELFGENNLGEHLRFISLEDYSIMLEVGDKRLINLRMIYYFKSKSLKVEELVGGENEWLFNCDFEQLPFWVNQMGNGMRVFLMGNGWGRNRRMEKDIYNKDIFEKGNVDSLEVDNSLAPLRPHLWIIRGERWGMMDKDSKRSDFKYSTVNKKWYSLANRKLFYGKMDLIDLCQAIVEWNEWVGKRLLAYYEELNRMDKREMELRFWKDAVPSIG